MTNRRYTRLVLASSVMGSIFMVCVLTLYTALTSKNPTYEVFETKLYASFFMSRWYDVFLLPPVALIYAWIFRGTSLLCTLNGVNPLPWKQPRCGVLYSADRIIGYCSLMVYLLVAMHAALNLYLGLGNVIPIVFGPLGMLIFTALISLTNIKNWTNRKTEKIPTL